MAKNIILIGFYNSNNLGDKLLAKEIIKIYENIGNIICIDFTTGNVVKSENIEAKINFELESDHLRVYRNTKVFRYLSLAKFLLLKQNKFKKKIEELDITSNDIVVFSSGNMIMDLNPVWPKLISTYIKCLKNSNIYFTYVGVGPVNLLINKMYLKSSLKNVKKFTVRDRNSLNELNKLGMKNVVNCLDPILKSEITSKDNATSQRIGIAILGQICFKSKNEYSNYILAITKIIKKLIIEGQEVVLFSTDASDYNEIYKLIKLNNIPEKLIKVIKNQKDIESLYNTLSFLVGGRMHSMILAQQKVIPYLGFKWQNKISELFKNVENQKIFELDNELDIDNIYTTIIQSMNNEIIQKEMIYLNQNNNPKVDEGSLISDIKRDNHV